MADHEDRYIDLPDRSEDAEPVCSGSFANSEKSSAATTPTTTTFVKSSAKTTTKKKKSSESQKATTAGPKFEISMVKEMTAYWSWDAHDEVCPICRNEINELCIECLYHASGNVDEKCTFAEGECEHAYHFHCISKWLNTRPCCPLCNKSWVLAKVGK